MAKEYILVYAHRYLYWTSGTEVLRHTKRSSMNMPTRSPSMASRSVYLPLVKFRQRTLLKISWPSNFQIKSLLRIFILARPRWEPMQRHEILCGSGLRATGTRYRRSSQTTLESLIAIWRRVLRIWQAMRWNGTLLRFSKARIRRDMIVALFKYVILCEPTPTIRNVTNSWCWNGSRLMGMLELTEYKTLSWSSGQGWRRPIQE